jgi:hypothetical protein
LVHRHDPCTLLQILTVFSVFVLDLPTVIQSACHRAFQKID